MTEAVETADAAETAAFAAMQKGEDQPGSDQLPKEQPPIDGEAAPAPAAAESGSKETPAADPPAPAAEPDKKVVPIQALDAERDRRKAAQEAARLNESALADARQRLKQIAEMQRQVLPDASEDPIKATQAVVDLIGNQIAQQTMLHQAQETLRLSSVHEGEYARQFPEYNDAVQYLHKQVIGEMMEFQGLSAEQAAASAAVEAAKISAAAMAAGINPAIPMLRLAQMRGWRPNAPAAQTAPAPAPAAAAATPTPAEQLLAQSAKTLETIAAGQQAARSGAGMRGGADTPPSLREIAELSASDDPEDIKRVEAFWKTGGVRRAMG